MRPYSLVFVVAASVAACVKGVTPEQVEEIKEAIPPRVVALTATPQGWCGPCADVTVDWEVETTQADLAVELTVEMAGTSQTLTGLKGPQTVKVCGNTSGTGAEGSVSIAVPGLAEAHAPVPLQQTLDGQNYVLTFECPSPFVNAWATEGRYDDLVLFPADVHVSDIRNWTFFDLNGSGAPEAGEPSPKIKLLQPSPVADFIADDTWKPAPAGLRLANAWQASLENPTAWAERRCLPQGEPATEDWAIDLQALVRVTCAE